MSGKGFSYGLNLAKKPSASKALPARRKLNFDDDDDEVSSAHGAVDHGAHGAHEILEVGGFPAEAGGGRPPGGAKQAASKRAPPEPAEAVGGTDGRQVTKKKQPQAGGVSTYGDLSSALSSARHASGAAALDPGIYDYDAFHSASARPAAGEGARGAEDAARRPKYMGSLLAAAATRRRDAAVAQEKKLAREREAEGDAFAGRDKFVTSAYKRQQEENRRAEAAEERREAAERRAGAGAAAGAGMATFNKNMLAKREERHEEAVRAAEERMRAGGGREEGEAREEEEEEEEEMERSAADLAREINAKTGNAIAVNDEGEVVDKRQLLRGGLNLAPRPKGAQQPGGANSGRGSAADRAKSSSFVGGVGGAGRQAQRERQTRMMEAQLEQASKRAFDEEAAEMEKVERAAKSRKTESDISSAKERYLVRKREAEEAKKKKEGVVG